MLLFYLKISFRSPRIQIFATTFWSWILFFKNYALLFDDYWFRDMINFNFSEKGLGLVSPPQFWNGFSTNIFLMLHSINWANVIVSLPLLLEILDTLPLLLEILDNVCITIVCLPGRDVIKFEINPIFLIKPFCFMTKNSRQSLNILITKRAFEVK